MSPSTTSSSSSGTAINTPTSSTTSSTSTTPAPAPTPSPAPAPTPTPFIRPKLRLEIRDLAHPGATLFLTSITPSTTLRSATSSVLSLLYQTPHNPTPTRSVTLVLRDKPGVAYTTGTELDSDHKEIHLSLGYVAGIKPADRLSDEITGVVVHELVHCFQNDARGTCPGGLIEGVADWVRLNSELAAPPPHWKRDTSKGWDAGYDRTAYFLQYLEDVFGEGSVRRLNAKLGEGKYVEKSFWPELFGKSVAELWEGYCEEVDGEKKALA
ncbi:related to pathogenesis-related protein NtPRp27 [Cephalotrichum gorgonifer]|uniref:Related to pathogenesis-related protein NtPRp27 n=1 Tax=Cephalotrichum gorgonifer TaxID=2041049 RepID=A0AAE8SYL3_9PEZI|nr:related to pathogenesis-related protein NtPRp27 [Cephalotrichum gorgonifer]